MSSTTADRHTDSSILHSWTEAILARFNVPVSWGNRGRSQDDTMVLPDTDQETIASNTNDINTYEGVCLHIFTPTGFGHCCDHLQGVSLQEYN